ncbi:MAG: sigma-70 family RNA polymerase sigma factor [Desulfoferrobacter sp.]
MNREANDQQLMQAVSRGDLDAFNEIVLRYQGLGWKAAYQFLGDAMEAEDVVQETFLKILQTAPRYRPTASFCTYFYRILTHLCIDRIRKKRLISMENVPEMADSSPSPTESLFAKERRDQVRAALDTLPPKQKAAMILRHYQGLSYTEVAQILGVTSRAVEGLISRARASLRVSLAHL